VLIFIFVSQLVWQEVLSVDSTSKRGSGKRLSDSQRLEIITKLEGPNPPSKRAIAREYGIVESSVRKLWNQRRFPRNVSTMPLSVARIQLLKKIKKSKKEAINMKL
jgi:CENP-B N-terminal DNA-binding domain